MSEQIKKGDLVIAIHACCDRMLRHPAYGLPLTVTGFHAGLSRCDGCGWAGNITWAELDERFAANVSWLKRIPPLEELQTYRITDETTA